MADSFSSNLRLRLQATGSNRNVWGENLNAAALVLLEAAICGEATIVMADADVTLSVANGAADQARNMILNLTGAPTVSTNIIVPALTKLYLVINATTIHQTVKVAGGTGVGVPSSARQLLICDGVDVYPIQTTALGDVANADALGGLPASAYALLNGINLFTKAQSVAFVNLIDGGVTTMDASLSNNFYWVVGGNRVLIVTNPSDGQAIELWAKQDGVGGRSITWPGNFVFTGSPSTSGIPNAIDRFSFKYNKNLNIFESSGLVTPTAGLTVNEDNVNLFARLGSPVAAATFNIQVNPGVIISSRDCGTPALDLTGFPAGTVLNITNNGYILGKGGDAGNAGYALAIFSSPDVVNVCYARPGRPGGVAVKGPGTGVTVNFTNGAGFIWGGGGGGGGGGACSNQNNGAGAIGVGGGGGGGAGGGKGGSSAGSTDSYGGTASVGTEGTDGSTGPNGVHGTGVAGSIGTSGAGNATGGTGGDGGDWGQAGGNGDSPTGQLVHAAGGGGGSAGKAVDLNGAVLGSGFNFTSGQTSPHVKGAIT